MRGGRSRHRCRWGRERRGPRGSGVGVSASEPPTTQQPHEKWKQVPAAQRDPRTPLGRAHGSQTERDPRGRTSRSWQSHATEKRSMAKRDGRWGPRVLSHGPHVSWESGPGPSTLQLRFHGAQEPSRAATEQGCRPGGGSRTPSGGTAPSPVPAAVRAPRAHAPVAVSAATGEVWAHGGLQVTRPRLKSPRRVWR